MNEKMKDLFSNEEFVAKMIELETAEEVQALLAENEVELSLQEINQLRVAISTLVEGELDEADLESVAGGSLDGPMDPYSVMDLITFPVRVVRDIVKQRW